MRIINLDTWNRKQHFEHFNAMLDPYFAVTVPFDVTIAYHNAKSSGQSFFARYLHDCMKAINKVDNLRYRIVDNEIIDYEVIHASATFIREDKTFGCSFIEFDEDLSIFAKNVQKEKERIQNSTNLFPDRNSLDCIHCSAMPWVDFTGHKEPISGIKDSVPKLAYGKVTDDNGKKMMSIAITANHALVDGYHLGLFVEHFQEYLNS